MDVKRDYRITVALSYFKNHFPCNENGELEQPPVITERVIEEMCSEVFVKTQTELDFDGEKGQQLLRILLQMTMSDFPPLTSMALKVLFRHFTQYQELVEDLKQVQLLVSNKDVDNYHQIDRDLFILRNLTEKSELWAHWGKLSTNSAVCSLPTSMLQDRSRSLSGDDLLNDAHLDDEHDNDHDSNHSRSIDLPDVLAGAALGPPPPRHYMTFLEDYYPTFKRKCVTLLQLIMVSADKDDISAALHNMLDKAPLVAYLVVKDIMFRMKNLCFEESRNDLMNQQLLRNMRVYEVVLEFLSIPYDKKTDYEMPKLITLSHEFLRSFCRNNKENQSRLHMYVTIDNDAKEGSLSVENVEEVSTLVSLFRNNSDLCENVDEGLVAHIVSLIEHKQRNAVFLEFLQVLVSSCEKEVEGTQLKVVEEISKSSDDVRQFYVDSASFEQLIEMMRTNVDLDVAHPLRYHVELVKLMALCTRGKNGSTELKCASFMPMDHIVRVVTAKECIVEVKSVYLQFMLHCYIDTDIELKDANNAEYLECILDQIIQDLSICAEKLKRETRYTAELIALERYVCQNITEALIKFFEPNASQPVIDIKQHKKRFLAILKRLGELQHGPLKTSGHSKNWYRIAECNKRLSKRAKPIVTHAAHKSPPHCTTQLICELRLFLQPLQAAESSVLVDILHWPEHLVKNASEGRERFDEGGVCSKLIQHCKLLLVNKQENLCGRVLMTLCKMATSAKHNFYGQAKVVRRELLERYFGKDAVQTTSNKIMSAIDGGSAGRVEFMFDSELKPMRNVSLTEVQCKLNKAGAVDLVIDIVVMDPSHEIFLKACQLAKALLFEGNEEVQMSFYHRLREKRLAGKFFRAFVQKLQTAQNRLKSDMMSGSSTRVKSALSTSISRRSSAAMTPLPMSLDQPFDAQQAASSQKSSFSESFQNGIGEFHVYGPSVMDITSYQEDERQLLLPPEVAIIEPVLRFLQLLCENHNLMLQNFLRTQGGRPDYNLVAESLMFLDTICGSTKGSLGVFGEVGEHNFSLITQTLITLTEFCQGPCHENQNTIATHESNGLDIIISLVLNDIRPLADEHMDLALEIKSNASKLLLAVMESRHDSDAAERVLRNMSHMSGGPKQLVKAIVQAYEMSSSNDFQVTKVKQQLLAHHKTNMGNKEFRIVPEIAVQSDAVDRKQAFAAEIRSSQPPTPPTIVEPKEVGHNIYILAHQLARHNDELSSLLNPDNGKNEATRTALKYYREHTAQIEIVRQDRKMERVVFPIHDVCYYLTPETKHNVFMNTERDAQGSKVTDFFDTWKTLYDEMKWQRKLQDRPYLSECTKRLRFWGRMAFFLAVLVNTVLALWYPFDSYPTAQTINPYNPFIYASIAAAGLHLYSSWDNRSSLGTSLSSQIGIFGALISFTLLLIAFLGIIPALHIIGIIQLINKVVHIISYAGNKGLVDKSWPERLSDTTVWYHCTYLMCCTLGLFAHPFIYSLLLFDVVANDETLRNVIRSVTRNWQSIILTGLLGLILVYHFSIIGFVFFQKDFALEIEPLGVEADNDMASVSTASSWNQCSAESCPEDDGSSPGLSAATGEKGDSDKTVNWGLRNGGGIGDVLRKMDPHEPAFLWRILYDVSFWIVLIIIVLNLIFGVIIDTFGDLRTEKNEKEDILRNTCFICGLERGRFDNKQITFEFHNQNEHNLWHYLYFIVWLQVKDQTEFTGPESYVARCVEERNRDWFPRMQAISLKEDNTDSDQLEMRDLQDQMRISQQTIKELSRKIQELHQLLLESVPF
ncbi:ITR-1 protein [Aphelenchoides avenae]|nr:ITR-1 protein [Aphelenchus avenae]